jgi:hypothetical protein
MNDIMRIVPIVCMLLLPGTAAAQTFKCTDKAGKVTYSSTKCGELGLKDAGEVPDRINVNPAYQPPAATPRRESDVRGRPQQPPARARIAEPPAADTPPVEEPANPERRCFTVHTPKGNVTRCNDKPDE